MSIQLNQPAPDFTLYNSDKKEISLSQFRGSNVVLLFFPLAFSSVCTAELCSVGENLEQYNNLNATILAISVDSIYTLAKFKEINKISFNLVSDFNKEISKLYNSLYADFSYNMKDVSKRAAFVIDKNGIIKYAEILENAGLQPNFDTINKILHQL